MDVSFFKLGDQFRFAGRRGYSDEMHFVVEKVDVDYIVCYETREEKYQTRSKYIFTEKPIANFDRFIRFVDEKRQGEHLLELTKQLDAVVEFTPENEEISFDAVTEGMQLT
jgi:hypothetical protein